MREKHKIRPRVKPREIKLSPEKPKKEIYSDPIFRLAQNSRRVPTSAHFGQRRSSIFLSFTLVLNRIWIACISQGRKKRNLYEELANTIDEIEEGDQEIHEKLSALKNRIENQGEVNKSHEGK